VTARLGRREKWIYGSGELGISLTNTIFSVYLALYLTDVVGLEPGVAAAAFFVGSTWDYVNDPIVGYLSDRTRTRWGRRRPFLLFGALPFALAFSLLWWRPPIFSTIGLGIYYALAFALFDTAATFVYMPFNALTPELTDDYDERTELTSRRMFFNLVATLAAYTLPMLVIGNFRPENAGRVLLMGSIFGLISALPLLLVFWGTRERREFMENPEKPSLRKSLAAARRNRPFLFGLGLFLFNGVAVSITQIMLLYYVKYVVRREAQTELIMVTIFVVALLALPLWEWISRHLDKRWAYISGISFMAVVLLVLSSLSSGTALPVIIGLSVLAGIGVSAMQMLPWAIIPDAIEYGELQSGERQEGIFYSLIQLAMKVAASIAVPLTLMVLQVTGYVANSAVQPPSAVFGIRLVAGPIPALTLCIGILFTLLFPLRRDSFREITRQLELRRQTEKASKA
jgi:glycoside/pentoside/hexuronide:cation symporter, GPH family